MGELTGQPRGSDPTIRPPAPLDESHDLASFHSGAPSLDDWLKTNARKSEGATSRTYVIALESRVVGYYCLSAGSVVRSGMPTAKLRRGPDPIPVIVLGRLAVDSAHQARGLGSLLLRDALLRTASAAKIIGARALLVHAIDDRASAFYARYGFTEFPSGARSMFLAIETIAEALSQ